MKKYLYTFSAVVAMMSLASCDQFKEANDAAPVEPIKISLDLNTAIGGGEEVTFGDEMIVKLDNYTEGLHYEKSFSGSKVEIDGVVPGIYSVNVSGTATLSDGTEYILAASMINKPLIESLNFPLELKGSMKGTLVFSEIYYCGSKPPTGFSWFRDQFYEIANNTDEVQYLDGLHFAHTDRINSDHTMPIWPESDEGKYIYLDRVWKFPGSGTDYPLQPGESCVVAQFAANQKLEIYNPNSPVDLSTAEFEFCMNNPNYPDQPAVNMEHVYYDGSDAMLLPQYLTPVFGCGYVLFRIPDGETWNPAHDLTLQTKNAADSWSDIFAKLPLEYVIDVVEATPNESYVAEKNIPAVLDAGFVTVGGIYLGQGVTRKRDTKTVAANGAVLYQDTNNSSEDFECNVVPVIHRHSGVPSWNPSLQ